MTPLAAVGTLLIAAAFYAATLHVAARWVLGKTPLRQALLAGAAPAVVVVGTWLADLPGAVVFAAAVAVDLFAIATVYEQSARRTALLLATHVVVTLALGVALVNLWQAVGA